jgi:hypothetical protein
MNNNLRVLAVTVTLLAGACLAFGYVQWRAFRQRQTAREMLLAEIDGELQKPHADASEISRLLLALRKSEGHQTDPLLLLAAARLESARGHDQEAYDLLADRVDHGEPSLAELRAAAAALQRLHARTGDRGQARQAQSLAERAFQASSDPADLFIAWQMAFRCDANDDRDRLARSLEAHGDSLPGRALQTLLAADSIELARLDALLAEFEVPPLELRCVRAVKLMSSDALAAMRAMEVLVAEAPALVAVRHFAAAAIDNYLRSSDGVAEAERLRLLDQRDAHLAWLLKNADSGDGRRELWQQMRGPR